MARPRDRTIGQSLTPTTHALAVAPRTATHARGRATTIAQAGIATESRPRIATAASSYKRQGEIRALMGSQLGLALVRVAGPASFGAAATNIGNVSVAATPTAMRALAPSLPIVQAGIAEIKSRVVAPGCRN